MALTPEQAKSAYRVGRGFAPDENAVESTDLCPPANNPAPAAGEHTESAAGSHAESKIDTSNEDDCHG